MKPQPDFGDARCLLNRCLAGDPSALSYIATLIIQVQENRLIEGVLEEFIKELALWHFQRNGYAVFAVPGKPSENLLAGEVFQERQARFQAGARGIVDFRSLLEAVCRSADRRVAHVLIGYAQQGQREAQAWIANLIVWSRELAKILELLEACIQVLAAQCIGQHGLAGPGERPTRQDLVHNLSEIVQTRFKGAPKVSEFYYLRELVDGLAPALIAEFEQFRTGRQSLIKKVETAIGEICRDLPEITARDLANNVWCVVWRSRDFINAHPPQVTYLTDEYKEKNRIADYRKKADHAWAQAWSPAPVSDFEEFVSLHTREAAEVVSLIIQYQDGIQHRVEAVDAGDLEESIRRRAQSELVMDQFVLRYQPMMRAIAQRILPNPRFDDAHRADCVQEGWLKFTNWILPSLDAHRGAEIRGYIRQAANHAAFDLLRKLRKTEDDDPPDVVDKMRSRPDRLRRLAQDRHIFYKELLLLLFNGDSPPHRSLSFAYVKLLQYKPQEVAEKFRAWPLRRVMDTFLNEYCGGPAHARNNDPGTGVIPRKELENLCEPTVSGMDQPLGELLLDRKRRDGTRRTYAHLLKQITGDTTWEHYNTGKLPALVTRWSDEVRSQVPQQLVDPAGRISAAVNSSARAYAQLVFCFLDVIQKPHDANAQEFQYWIAEHTSLTTKLQSQTLSALLQVQIGRKAQMADSLMILKRRLQARLADVAKLTKQEKTKWASLMSHRMADTHLQDYETDELAADIVAWWDTERRRLLGYL